MQVEFAHFIPERFSFHEHPVLMIDKLWTNEERQYVLRAMQRAAWKSLCEMRHLRETFPDCGDWLKADIARAEEKVFLDRLVFPASCAI